MEKVLYRKYRSLDFDEIVGQDHITKTLKNALSKNKISHAYLFTGPRGVGKTSIARILAYQINGLKYNLDQSHIDIIEIDAASNRKIDEIRDLREKVHILPSQAKFKVYIIDEVHMLTKDSFNALLKTLEEPPEHVVFILATTDAHKLPETIISRTQRFTFRPISKADLFKHLKEIALKEKINIDDEALEIISEHGDGSFRDSISLLDQFSHFESQIDVNKVLNLLGVPKSDQINSLYRAIYESNDFKNINDILESLYNDGIEPAVIAKNLMLKIREKAANNPQKLSLSDLDLLDRLINVEASLDPANFLLVSILKTNQQVPQIINETQETIKEEQDISKDKKDIEKPIQKTNNNINKNLDEIWEDLLKKLKTTHNTLYAILKMAEVKKPKENQIELVFDFPFHKNIISESKNLKIISDTIKNQSGKNFKIQCILSGKDPKKLKANKDLPLDTITEIFGGGELVDI